MDNQPQEQPQEEAAVPLIPRSYNPMSDGVIEKPYSSIAYDVSQEQIGKRIPEPTFNRQSIGKEDPYKMLGGDRGGGGASGGGAKSSQPALNPAMNNLSDKDKQMGAEHLAKLIIDAYEGLNTAANEMCKFPARKIRKLQASGEIDLSVEIPYDYGKTISAGEFIKDFNEQNKDTITVSKEFKKEILPPLTRILEKKGAGISDEQMVGYLIAKDVGVKAVLIGQMRGSMNDMISVIIEYTAALKEGRETPQGQTQQSQPKPQPQPQPQSTPKQEREAPYVNEDGNDYNFVNNETVMQSSVEQMEVPSSGRDRIIMQKAKERKWAYDAEKYGKMSYEQAYAAKRANKKTKTPKDYITPIDEEQIAEAIILNESINQPSKKVDTQMEGLD
jgi:hypothetical protein